MRRTPSSHLFVSCAFNVIHLLRSEENTGHDERGPKKLRPNAPCLSVAWPAVLCLARSCSLRRKNNNDVIGLVPAPCQLGNGVKWRHTMFAGATHAGTTSLL